MKPLRVRFGGVLETREQPSRKGAPSARAANPNAPGYVLKSVARKAEPQTLADIIRDAPRIDAPASLTTHTPTPSISRADVDACKPSANHGDLLGAIIAIGKKYREGAK